MRSGLHFFRQVALGSLVLMQFACGETSRDRSSPNAGGAAQVATAGGRGGQGQVAASGGASASGAAGLGSRAVDQVDIGTCQFEDPNVELLARYEILQADEADGAIDGSAGPRDVKRLEVTQEVGALGGIECLENLEELSLSVYGPAAPPVGLSSLAGLSRLRKLWLAGPFVLDGTFGGLALEELLLRAVPLVDLEEVAKEVSLRDLYLTDVPLSSLSGVERLAELSTLRIEGAAISSLTPLERTSTLEELELKELPALTSLAGIEPHTGLRSLFTDQVPLTSLTPLAQAEGLESLNVGTSSLTSLRGLENKPALTNVTVTNARVTDLTPLDGLRRLSYLSVQENLLVDLDPLARCPALSYLDVSKNAVSTLAPTAAMTSLQGLVADDNALTAIDAQLPSSLRTLSIAGNAIESLAPLAALALDSLDISGNPLTSLKPLFDLPALSTLTADDVGASDLESFPLARLRALSSKNNQITSVAPLAGLGELSVNLSGNLVSHFPDEFVGPAAQCGGLVLLDNPLDAAALARLTWLCTNGAGSYQWDSGACNKCPII